MDDLTKAELLTRIEGLELVVAELLKMHFTPEQLEAKAEAGSPPAGDNVIPFPTDPVSDLPFVAQRSLYRLARRFHEISASAHGAHGSGVS